MLKSSCPSCKNEIDGVFPLECPVCGFSVRPLAGNPSSSFQVKNWNKHTDIIQGRDIGLYGSEYNASFDHNGTAVLEDLVRFTVTYGDRGTISARGGKLTEVILSYIPEPIGAGTALYTVGTVTCSGIAILSPSSIDYGHTFPVINEWVISKFGESKSVCKICERKTDFGQPVCGECYLTKVSNWRDLLNSIL